MELIPIRLILDDSGKLVDEYTQLPVINQYATNYKLEVAFLNDMPDARLVKAVFEINGKSSPAKVLSPTLLRINLGEDKFSYYSHEYQLTQYETQFYQDELYFNLYVYNSSGTQITSTRVSLQMSKQMFNKLIPAGLDENEGSLTSITKAIYDLESAVINKGIADTESFETKVGSEAKLEEAKNFTEEKIFESKILIEEKIESDLETLKGNINQNINLRISTHNDSQFSHPDLRNYIRELQESKDDVPPNVYTKSEVDYKIESRVSSLVNSSPDLLNTLSELAAAIGNDPNFATSVANALALKVNKDTYDRDVGEAQENISELQNDVVQILSTLENKLDKTSVPVLRIWG